METIKNIATRSVDHRPSQARDLARNERVPESLDWLYRLRAGSYQETIASASRWRSLNQGSSGKRWQAASMVDASSA